MKLSIVTPVYNEESTIGSIINLIETAARKIDYIQGYELIVVEDGSSDGTRKILADQIEPRENVKVFYQTHNQGKGAAITRGFQESSGDVVLIQDADMEYDPNEYPVLLGPIKKGLADVVYGSRFKGDTSRVLYYWHYLGNKFLTTLSNMFTNLNLTDMETCYKVFQGDLIRSMNLESQRFGIEPEITAKISKIKGIRVYEVPISYYGRTYEDGKKIGWKDGISAIYSILKFNLFSTVENSYKNSPAEILKKPINN